MTDPLSTHFVPPLLFSCPTGPVTFKYVGTDVAYHAPRPLRFAREGYFSIYGSWTNPAGNTRVVLALSFEEDDLPSLHRQTYYHYLDQNDAITVSEATNSIEFAFNNLPSTPRLPSEQYKNTLVWRVEFLPLTISGGIFATFRSLLAHIRDTMTPFDSNQPVRDMQVLDEMRYMGGEVAAAAELQGDNVWPEEMEGPIPCLVDEKVGGKDRKVSAKQPQQNSIILSPPRSAEVSPKTSKVSAGGKHTTTESIHADSHGHASNPDTYEAPDLPVGRCPTPW